MASRKIEDLRPATQPKIIAFEAALAKAGLAGRFKRSCTFRSQEEQNALRMRGRFPLAMVNAAYKKVGLAPITDKENERAVTWKRVSDHTGRKAVDYYEEVEGRASYDIKVDIDDDHIPDWEEFGEIAESCGLEWGGRWKKPDYPHVQDPEP